ncbi:hypothetical protein FCM35_KLT11293 [Carex littledalei]|uniref:DUF7963 domain-containing protein n=1 Tax=Carex littledalei TaxID=544730 RepID=A0A833QQM9_9POAL|nr:hypothetical protein FCM35_KLT11293 [Carex littledalei]
MATESAPTEAVVGPSPSPSPSITSEETAARAVQKRFEGLMTVRAKAIKGKGAWYWAHLEPVLVQSNDTNLPKAVKLRCSLCDAVFSASNPSRTASEHLKRGTCPNFSMPPSTSSASSPPRPISSIPPPPPLLNPCTSSSSGRKRSSPVSSHLALIESHSVYTPPPAIGAPPLLQPMPTHSQPIVLSGGKQDLGALAMLEDSVKKLKSPNPSPGPVANPQSRRLVWETCLSELRSLGKVAVRLIFLHATACGFRCNSSMARWLAARGPGSDRAHKLVFVAAHSKLERRDFSNDEERDGELFAIGDDDDDVLQDSPFGDGP